jgi:hypothetical protein
MKILTTIIICLMLLSLKAYSQLTTNTSDEKIIFYVTEKGELHHLKIRFKSEEYVRSGKGRIISVLDTNGLNIIKANNDINILGNKVTYIRQAIFKYQFDELIFFSTFSFLHPLTISYKFGLIDEIACDTSRIVFNNTFRLVSCTGNIPNVSVYNYYDKYFKDYDY